MKTIEKLSFILLTLVLLTFSYSYAQTNLVPNYSFEEHTNCPYARNQLNFATHWYNPCNGGTDYFNSCSYGISNWWTPFNAGGYQVPRTGVALAGIYLFYSTNYREYAGVTLTSELQLNKYYKISFYVSLVNGSRYATDAICAGIIQDSCLCDHTSIPIQYLLDIQPQVCNSKGSILSDTLNWMEVSGTFKAQGGEKYLIIGDFYPDEQNTIVLSGDSNAYPICGYFIDDVSLYEVDSVAGIEDENVFNNISVYPNPAQGKVWIDFQGLTKENIGFELYTSVAGLLQTYVIPTATKSYEIDLSGLPQGIYFYQLTDSKGGRKSGKLIINR